MLKSPKNSLKDAKDRNFFAFFSGNANGYQLDYYQSIACQKCEQKTTIYEVTKLKIGAPLIYD